MTIKTIHQDLYEKYDFDLGAVFNLSQKAGRVGAWVYSLENDSLWWSDEVFELFEVNRSTPINNEVFFNRVHDDDRENVRQAFARVIDGENYDITHRAVINGKVLWFNEKGSLYFDAIKQSDMVVGMVQDITRETEHLLEIERQNRELTVLKSYFSQSTQCSTMEEIVKVANDSICKIIPNSYTTMLVAEQETEQYSLFIAGEVGLHFLKVNPEELPRYFGFTAIKYNTERYITIDHHPDMNLQAELMARQVQSLTCFPIAYDGSAFASLTVASGIERQLNSNEKSFCQTICGYLSYQLKNTMLGRIVEKGQSDIKSLEEDMDVIFNESLDFIVILDKDGRILRANSGFYKKLGFSPSYVKRRVISAFAVKEDTEIIDKAIGDILAHGYIRGFCSRLLCKNGIAMELEWNVKYVSSHSYSIAILRDVTRQLAYEKTKNELEKSVEIEKLKTEFFATLSHELKTPINIILSSVQLIALQDNLSNQPSQNQRFNKYIEQNAYRLLRLVNNLIDVSIIDSKFMTPHFRCHDIVESLKTVVQSSESYAMAKNITLSFVTESMYNEIYFDRNMVDRVMLNLLSNSIKHTASGGTIQVAVSEDDDFIKVSVSDNGTGISSELLPIIFDRFRITRADFRRNCEGSGIGLSIVKNLVEMHGGAVAVDSTVDAGSRFSFTISKHLANQKIQEGDTARSAAEYDDELRQSRIKIEMSY